MKIIISTLSILIFSVLITACGGGGGSDPGTTGTTTPPPTAPPPATPPPANGSISVRWDIPTTRHLNGAALTPAEIGGFKLYYTTNINQVPTQVKVNIANNTTTQYTFSNLPTGMTYYIYVSTYDVNGDESPLSDPVTKTL